MLTVNSINIFYGYIGALSGVSIQVNEGELAALIGSNGSGKSTLIKAIMGVIPCIDGSICFMEKRIDGLDSHIIANLGISIVPEGRRLFPYMTVLENLQMGAYVEKARNTTDETLEYVYEVFPKLKNLQVQLARTLSGGEQQMLAIGRALMAKPKLLLLDEPSLGLAPILTERLFEVIKQIKESGVTVLLAEQDAYQALSIADKAYLMENGKVIMSGSGQELLSNKYIKKAYLGM
jgi:branched-chain amino acid transport system ATP-binding protein